MLDKLFGWGKKKEEPEPSVSFGRYSDNNKHNEKVNRWTDADALFKEKKYFESISAFFEYLKDDAAQNVLHERNGNEGRFELFQGSKIVRGTYNNEQLKAEATLAKMPQPSVPVMRRLLEMKIDQLPDAFRAVFVLRAVEELTVEETAAALDIPQATVRTRFFRARSLLRESIEREADSALEDAFAFAGERCDRIVAGVLARLG